MTPDRAPLAETARPPLVVLAGATATGKTALAIELAETLALDGVDAEIISADSRQVYRGMDIGTAKASAEERGRVRHWGLDLVDPDEPFSVADFMCEADRALASIGGGQAAVGRRAAAILAGGTGFYLRAVARGLAVDALPWDPELRATLDAELARGGLASLVARLRQVAPGRAETVDLRNPRRVVRALEIALARGDEPLPEPRGYGRPVLWLGLRVEPEAHRRRIASRARAQFDAGLIEETRALVARFDAAAPSFSGIGYAESLAVIEGRMDRESAIAADARRNVLFARRQATWFRRESEIRWFDATDALPTEPVLEAVRSYLEVSGPE